MTSAEPFNSGRHIADRLPAYVNDTLDDFERDRVDVHLKTCNECSVTLLAWQAIAGAVQIAADRTDREAVSASWKRSLTNGTTGLSPVIPERSIESMENAIHASSLTIPALGHLDIGLQARSRRRLVGRWARPAFEVAIATALVFAILGGFVMHHFGGIGSGRSGNFAASTVPSHAQADCTTQPRTADSLVKALSVDEILKSNSVDLTSWLESAYQFSIPPMPSDVVPPKADSDAVVATWAQYAACMAQDPSKAYGVMTDNAVRRLFYNNVWNSLNAGQLQAEEVKAANEPVGPGTATPGAESTPDAVAAKAGTQQQTIDQGTLAAEAGNKYAFGEMRVIADGKIFVELIDPADASHSPAGFVVFQKSGATWLIDEILIFVG